MAGINIPGVTDQYNTTETVEKLMQIERIPLNREQKTLETYKNRKRFFSYGKKVNDVLPQLYFEVLERIQCTIIKISK